MQQSYQDSEQTSMGYQNAKDQTNETRQKEQEEENNNYFFCLAKEIENEEYFKEMREWYLHKYVSPIIERSVLIVVSILSIFATLVGFHLVSIFLPIKEQVPIAVPINDSSSNHTKLFRLDLAIPEENTNISLQKYILMTFLEVRESYDPKDNFASLRRNVSLLEKLASTDLLREYENLIDESNPFSIKLVYRENTRVNVEVSASGINIRKISPDEVEIFSKEDKEQIRKGGINLYRAEAIFYKETVTPQENFRERFKAVIDFSYNDIKFLGSEGKFAPLVFRVFGYKANPI